MRREEHTHDDETLVETQGVNAGQPADEPMPEEEPPAPDAARPDRHGPDGRSDDEMVGLPDQKPGSPGQQRSVDTS